MTLQVTASTYRETVPRVGVVIPCYRVGRRVLPVIAAIGPEVARIYVIDDACPDGSGALVEKECLDARVTVVRNPENLGVGGAVLVGYRAAVADGCDCIVKIDGDGQMDPRLLPLFAAPILAGRADYTKGNRFHHIEDISAMPCVRLLGNGILSFMSKLSSGYWDVFDPTNGYTAISGRLISLLPAAKIHQRFFFESDVLFRLGLLNAVVEDIPMKSVYADEVSNLKLRTVIPQFAYGHARNLAKRLVYNYFLRGFSVASIELAAGALLLIFAAIFGAWAWVTAGMDGRVATSGTVMLAALPAILGTQLLLSFLSFDTRRMNGASVSSRLRPVEDGRLSTLSDATPASQPQSPTRLETDVRTKKAEGIE